MLVRAMLNCLDFLSFIAKVMCVMPFEVMAHVKDEL